jgi:hypothetical protein
MCSPIAKLSNSSSINQSLFSLSRKKLGMTNQGLMPGSQTSLTRKGSGQEWTRQDKTHIERASRLMTNCQNFIFFQPAVYKRGRDLNIKDTLIQLQLFCVFHPAFSLPVSLTKYKLLFSQGKPFSVPSHCDRDMVPLQIPTSLECC